MPNHVTNELHFHHCTEDRFHEILKDIQSDEAGLGSIDFRKLIPEPEGLYMGDLGLEEMKRYKDNNWYDWRMKNWNTKWNAYGFETPTYSGDTGTITFLTANGSPFRVLFKLSEKYPDVEFELRYADEDLGYNVGEISFIAGELIDDNSPQEGTAVAQELAADIIGIELSFDINSASGYVLSLLGNYTIESGARELFLVKKSRFGDTLNNVVHTLSRPSENSAYNISQEDLVVAALRFDPDVIVVGEIRDAEANSAVEASLTGHTVVTTVHSGPAESAHGRISLLCQRRFQLGMAVSLSQSRQAFPVVVFAHKCEDNSRKVMDITECEVTPDEKTCYRCLYRYNIRENIYENGKFHITGEFEKVNSPSEYLRTLLTRSGVPLELLNQF